MFLHVLTIFILSFFGSQSAYADGSKDLYPTGSSNLGARAWLRVSTTANENYPFANLGTHYVYAKAGETIAIASSAQGISNSARLRLYNTSNALIVDHQTPTSGTGSNVGKIASRAEEVAGPRLPGVTTGSGYTAVYHTVTVTGIYKVEFVSTGGETSTGTGGPTANRSHDDLWSQNSNTSLIAAWDVSVANAAKTQWIPGRAFAMAHNLFITSNASSDLGYHGKVKILTNDGYLYNVNNNGSNGIAFTFFVNNKGFYENNIPVYKSLDESTVAFLTGKVHNPNSADTNSDFTQKIFYTLPNTDLPTSASGAFPGGNTWLLNNRIPPTVSNVSIQGVDGTVGQVSNKGGDIHFTTNLSGTYTIEIKSTNNSFPSRKLTGTAIAGANTKFWDGKDGAGMSLPKGNFPAEIKVVLQGAEVHFPFFDMEVNPNGTIIQLLKSDRTTVESDIVYWNDSPVTTITGNAERSNSYGSKPNPLDGSQFIIPQGTSSNGGHTWGKSLGGNSLSYAFGNRRSIDTWTFITGDEEKIQTNIDVKITDLSVTVSQSKNSVKAGEELTYTVVVKNSFHPNDPAQNVSAVQGAPFGFTVPVGFVPKANGITFTATSSCGSQATALAFNTSENKYKSTLNMGAGCVITYTMTGTITAAMSANPTGSAEATILRPNDVTDYDATNPDVNTPPTDPHYECDEADNGGVCNNIKPIGLTYIPTVDLVVTKTANNAQVAINEDVIFTITVKNIGPDGATNVSVTDALPAGLTFKLASPSIGTFASGVWSVGSLAKDASATLTMTATATTEGTKTNTAVATSSQEELTPLDNTASASVVICKAGSAQVGLSSGTLKN